MAKGQGLSLNTIIIAIIVLVVLVVLIMIFTGYIGNIFGPGITSCQSVGGQCQLVDLDNPRCGLDSFGNNIVERSEGTAQCREANDNDPNYVCCQIGI